MRWLLPASLVLTTAACAPLADAPLVGEDGDPRFNLYFDNQEQVDLDLRVLDPDGEEISWENPSSESGGVLDVDCKCSSCPDDPSENVAWAEGGPSGTYTVWVEYYTACQHHDGAGASFLVRTARSGELGDSWSGTLYEGESERWSFELP